MSDCGLSFGYYALEGISVVCGMAPLQGVDNVLCLSGQCFRMFHIKFDISGMQCHLEPVLPLNCDQRNGKKRTFYVQSLFSEQLSQANNCLKTIYHTGTQDYRVISRIYSQT